MNYTVIFIVDHLPKDYQELHPSGRLLADENRSEPCAQVKSWDHLPLRAQSKILMNENYTVQLNQTYSA